MSRFIFSFLIAVCLSSCSSSKKELASLTDQTESLAVFEGGTAYFQEEIPGERNAKAKLYFQLEFNLDVVENIQLQKILVAGRQFELNSEVKNIKLLIEEDSSLTKTPVVLSYLKGEELAKERVLTSRKAPLYLP